MDYKEVRHDVWRTILIHRLHKTKNELYFAETDEKKRAKLAKKYGVSPDDIVKELEKRRREFIYDNVFFQTHDPCHIINEDDMVKYEPFTPKEHELANECLMEAVEDFNNKKRKREPSTKKTKTKKTKKE